MKISSREIKEKKEKAELVEEIAHRLGEHFDCVQILVSWNIDTYTHDLAYGIGNWYARQGMAEAFIKRDQAKELALEISNCYDEEE